MRKIILNLAVTLDGFIEGPNGETDWCIMEEEPGQEKAVESHFDKFLSDIDTIFYGRVSYDLWGQYQPESKASEAEKKLWEGVHSKTKYVFTHHPEKADGNAIYLSSDLADNVNNIKNQPGKNIWLYGGAKLISSFMKLDLIDQYLLAVHPVILGKGKPLFSDAADRQKLSLNGAVTSPSGVVLLNYDTK